MTARVLLTGASRSVGSRLLRELEAGGRMMRYLARHPARVAASRATEGVTGDCLDLASLDAVMKGVDQAFYLVHSMASGASFAALDREAAANFGRAARRRVRSAMTPKAVRTGCRIVSIRWVKSRTRRWPPPQPRWHTLRRLSCTRVLERSIYCGPIPRWLRPGDRVLTHCPSSACLTETYR